jgi:hypothetical protein
MPAMAKAGAWLAHSRCTNLVLQLAVLCHAIGVEGVGLVRIGEHSYGPRGIDVQGSLHVVR